jgi:hypothetical protein
MADHERRQVDPRAFVQWFLGREAAGEVAPGVFVDRGELRLYRAVVFLERRMLPEALAEANAAAALDPALRPRALIVARMCVLREIEDLREGFAPR